MDDHNDRLSQWLHQHSSVAPRALQQAQYEAQQRGSNILDILIQKGLIPAQQRQAILQAARVGSESPTTQPTPGRPGPQLQGYEGIERYSGLEEIGSGGMGRVFRAQVNETGIPVVIKTLLSMRSSGRQLERFHREGMALARLSHPNIARVYDFRLSKSQSSSNCYPYLVMEHIQGQTLDQYFDSQRDNRSSIPSDDQVQKIFIPLAMALIHCHENGITHRDIKPENILVEVSKSDSKVRPVLVDFGLVRIDKDTLRESLELSQQLTQSGQMTGSPAFASPEQLHGEVEKFSSAIDVWGFGATLYWAVSGKVPYNDRSLIELLTASEKKNPRSLRSHNPKFPKWLNSLCILCLQREPGRRPSMEQVLEILETKSCPSPSRSPKIFAAMTLFSIVLVFSLTVFLFRDTTPPTLTLTAETSYSRRNSIKLAGRVSDKHPKQVWITKQGPEGIHKPKSYPLLDDGRFKVSLSLTDGSNEFLIWGEDQSGQKSQIQSISILKDKEAPKFDSLNYPRSSFDETVPISGQVNEAGT
ncbi:MAG: serine/threonine-protein kinase, partial [Planctomycetota bacterium]|nr:serine/threonine-protein kinase [Planctomycetota bacterium]